MVKRKKEQKQTKNNVIVNGNVYINGNSDSSKEKYCVDDLLQRVNEYVENFEFELARKFCQKAIDLEPENINALVTYGNICAEVSDVENALEFFSKAADIEPDDGHVKFLYMGQLSEGHESVKYFEKAIEIMKKDIEFSKNDANNGVCFNEQDLSSVYCSLAEIYMTDCCMDKDAENKCQQYCNAAISSDENSLDALVTMCNFLLSNENLSDAKRFLEKGFQLWEKVSKCELDNIPNVIGYESRVNLIKLLIELNCYEKVSVIVDELIEENEDDVRIWYYLGLSKCLMKDTDNPRFYLEKALELIEKNAEEDGDDEIKNHINELLQDCPLECDENDAGKNMEPINEDIEENEAEQEEKMEH